MSGLAKFLVPGQFGIDTVHRITPLVEDPFKVWVKKRGVRFIARYGPRNYDEFDRKSHPLDFFGSKKVKKRVKGVYKTIRITKYYVLAVDEAKFLREECKLMILPVQFAPGAVLGNGKIVGNRMARWATKMGIPRGVHLWCDLEGNAAVKAGVSGCMAFVDEWSAAVDKAGYNAGLYLSLALPWRPRRLKSEDLEKLKHVTCFWRSVHSSICVPKGGFDIKQGSQTHAWLFCGRDLQKKKIWQKLHYDPDKACATSTPSNPKVRPILWA